MCWETVSRFCKFSASHPNLLTSKLFHQASPYACLHTSALFSLHWLHWSHFSTSTLNLPSVGTHCPYTAQVKTHMHGHRASTTAAGATTLNSRTYQEGWPNITSPSHLLPSLGLMLLLVQQTRLEWLHGEPQQRNNWLKVNSIATNRFKRIRFPSTSSLYSHTNLSARTLDEKERSSKERCLFWLEHGLTPDNSNCSMTYQGWCFSTGLRQWELETTLEDLCKSSQGGVLCCFSFV